jgi:hypothetical protein
MAIAPDAGEYAATYKAIINAIVTLTLVDPSPEDLPKIPVLVNSA